MSYFCRSASAKSLPKSESAPVAKPVAAAAVAVKPATGGPGDTEIKGTPSIGTQEVPKGVNYIHAVELENNGYKSEPLHTYTFDQIKVLGVKPPRPEGEDEVSEESKGRIKDWEKKVAAFDGETREVAEIMDVINGGTDYMNVFTESDWEKQPRFHARLPGPGLPTYTEKSMKSQRVLYSTHAGELAKNLKMRCHLQGLGEKFVEEVVKKNILPGVEDLDKRQYHALLLRSVVVDRCNTTPFGFHLKPTFHHTTSKAACENTTVCATGTEPSILYPNGTQTNAINDVLCCRDDSDAMWHPEAARWRMLSLDMFQAELNVGPSRTMANEPGVDSIAVEREPTPLPTRLVQWLTQTYAHDIRALYRDNGFGLEHLIAPAEAKDIHVRHSVILAIAKYYLAHYGAENVCVNLSGGTLALSPLNPRTSDPWASFPQTTYVDPILLAVSVRHFWLPFDSPHRLPSYCHPASFDCE